MTLEDTWDFLLVLASSTYMTFQHISIIQIITKFKSRFSTGIRIEELKIESDEGLDVKMNDKTFQLTQKTTSTSQMISYSENENSKIQEELAKLHNRINILENKMHEDYHNLHKKIRKFKI